MLVVSQEPPKLEYPCPYPIKVMGEHSDDFASVIVAIVQLPEIKERLRNAGYSTTGEGPEAFARLLAEEVPKWKEVIQLAGAKSK